MNRYKLIPVLVVVGLLMSTTFASATATTWDYAAGILQPLLSQSTAQVKVPYVTATSTTATSTLLKTNISGPITIIGEYFTNFTNYIRSRISAIYPLAYNSATGAISAATSSASSAGVLSAADWTTFNSKQGTVSLTTTGTAGAATFIGNVLNIPNYANTTYTAGTGLTLTGTTFSVNTSQNIATLSNLTSNGLVKTSGSAGTLSIASAGTDYQAPVTLTTTGTAGASTFIGNTLNIPNYANTTYTAFTPLSISGANVIAIATSSGSVSGFLQSGDWTTFNNKVSSTSVSATSPITYNSSTGVIACPTCGTSSGSVSSVSLTAPTGLSVSGSPVTTTGTLALSLTAGYNIPLTASTTNWNTAYNEAVSSWTAPLQYSAGTASITQAGTSANGYLSSTDWNTFNGKQAAGSYLTALTGDGTASGPGSAALTLATVNSNVGTFTYPSVTVNAKGLITAISNGTDKTASTTLLGDNNTFSGTDTFNNTITGSVSGNAGTATKLATARNINGIPFDGTSNIIINAASSTLLSDNNTFSGSNVFTKSSTVQSATQFTGFLVNNGTNYAAKLFGSSGSNDNGALQLLNSGATNINIVASGSSYFNGGNVGIGTTSPFSALDVNGTIRATNSATGNYLSLADTGATGVISSNSGNVQIVPAALLDVTSQINARSFVDRDNTAYYLDPANTGNSLLVAGSVGIGTTSPAATLGLQGSIGVNSSQLYLQANGSVSIGQQTGGRSLNVGGNGIQLTNGTIASALALSGNTTSLQSDNGSVQDNFLFDFSNNAANAITFAGGASGATIFKQGTTETLRITSGGNVGIGTSTPGSLLSLNGIANFTTATSTFYSTGGINLASGCFAIGGNCLSHSNLGGIVPIANGGTATTTQVTNGVNFFDGTRITSGTALTFNGTTLSNGLNSQGGGLDINNNDSFFGTGVNGGGAFVDVGNLGTSNGVYFDARGSGAVGVHIRSTGASGLSYESNSTAGGGDVTSMFISATSTANSYLINAGNLGINNTTPWTALAVTGGFAATASSTIGNGTVSGGLTISGDATTTGGMLVGSTFTNEGPMTTGFLNVQNSVYAGTSFIIPGLTALSNGTLYSAGTFNIDGYNGTSQYHQMTFLGNGTVGINNSSPTGAKLQVSGGAIAIDNNQPIYTNGGTANDNNWQIGRNIGSISTALATANYQGITTSGASNEGVVFGISGGNSIMELLGSGNTYIRNNVAIGTTTFGTLLNLGGVANFGTATSTFYGSGGINLTSGCFAIAGTCISGSGGSGVTGGTAGMLAAWTSGTTLTATSTPTFTAFLATSTTATSTMLGAFRFGTTTDALGSNFNIVSNRPRFGPTLAASYPDNYVPSCPDCMYMVLDKGKTLDDDSIVWRDQGNARAEEGLIGGNDFQIKTVTGTYPTESFTTMMDFSSTSKSVGIGNVAPTTLLSVGTNSNFTIDYSGNASTTGVLTVDGSYNGTAANGKIVDRGHEVSGGGAYMAFADDTLGNIGYFGQNSVINGGTAYSQFDIQAPQGTGSLCLSAGGRSSSTAGNNCDISDSPNDGIGIGTSTPSAALTVLLQTGNVYPANNAFLVASSTGGATTNFLQINNKGAITLSAAVAAGTTGDYVCINTSTFLLQAGTVCSLSSEKVKNDIVPLDSDAGLAAILKLNPVTFKYDQGFGDSGAASQAGLIAEQAANINPLFAEYADSPMETPNGTINTGDPDGINWNAITASLVEAVQQQQHEIDALGGTTKAPQNYQWEFYALAGVFALYMAYNEWDKRRK